MRRKGGPLLLGLGGGDGRLTMPLEQNLPHNLPYEIADTGGGGS